MRSCPSRVYRQADAAFSDRLDLSFDKTAAAAAVLMHLQGKLDVLQSIIPCLEGFAPTWRMGAAMGFFDGMNHADARHPPADELVSQANGPPTKEGDVVDENLLPALDKAMTRVDGVTEQLLELLRNTAEMVALDLLEAWAAYSWFSRCCVGLEPEILLAAWRFPAGLSASIVESLSPYSHLKPRDDQTTQLAEAPSRAWRERFSDL